MNLHSRGRRGHGAPDLGSRSHPRLQARSARGRRQRRRLGVDGAQFPNFTLAAARMAESTLRRGAARPPGRAQLAGDDRPGQADGTAGRAGARSSHDRRPARPPGRGRGRRWRWSTARCCGSTATTCRRSARSSTTRPAPGPSRPRRPTRSRYTPRRLPSPRRWSRKTRRPRRESVNADEIARVREEAKRQAVSKRRCSASPLQRRWAVPRKPARRFWASHVADIGPSRSSGCLGKMGRMSPE